jgi:hypothetical protein
VGGKREAAATIAAATAAAAAAIAIGVNRRVLKPSRALVAAGVWLRRDRRERGGRD